MYHTVVKELYRSGAAVIGYGEMRCGLMEYEEALMAIISAVDPVRETERAALAEATGRILGEDIPAPFSVPHFPKSAMDGYAVRAEDVKDAAKDMPVKLQVVGEMLAGDVPSDAPNRQGQPGTAVRIMTGAMVPDGYDAVIRQEDTDYGETEVKIYRRVEPFTNYCKVGEDIEEGSIVLPAGRRIGRIEAGVLASLGIAEVPVLRKVRVFVLSTGSELCELESAKARIPEAGRIYNSIAYTLAASLPDNAFSFDHAVCTDDADSISAGIEHGLKTADVVITTGGVSVGKKDLLPEVLEGIGAKRVFSGVNIQPGTPTIGSVRDGKAILSLSGNPYAALVNFDLYFKPLAAKLTGCDSFLPVEEEAVLRSEYTKVNRLRRFVRARVEKGNVTLPAKSHASSVLSNLLDCNCYVDLPRETPVRPGDIVRIVKF